MIQLKCPCGKLLSVSDQAAGKIGKCPACGRKLAIAKQEEADIDDLASEVLASNNSRSRSARPIAAPFSPHVNVTLRGVKTTSGLGIAALVLGIIACLSCWIPVFGLLTIPFCILGIIFGALGFIISLVGRRSGVGMPLAGAFICVVAILVAGASTGSLAKAIEDSAQKAKKSNQLIALPEELPPRVHTQLPPSSPSNSGSPRSSSVSVTREPPIASPPPKKEDDAWISAENAVKQGDSIIRVESVQVETAAIQDRFRGEVSRSKDPYLVIVVRIANRSPTKKISYSTWAGADFSISRDYGTLKDNFGNSYKRIAFSIDKPVGRATETESIYPNKSLTDVLVFEPPIDKAQYLRLELPATNFGGTGMIRIQIPRSMVKGG